MAGPLQLDNEILREILKSYRVIKKELEVIKKEVRDVKRMCGDRGPSLFDRMADGDEEAVEVERKVIL